jgi:hypothetical protein
MGRADLGIIGAIVAILGGAYYVYTIVRGNTRPQRISWGVWSLIGILGAGSAVQGGAGPGAYVALVYVAIEITVFLLSLSNKYGKKGGEWYDYPVGIVAIITIVIWQLADLPAGFAATIAILADVLVNWLTLRDAWLQPKTESLAAWASSIVDISLAIAASAKFSYAAIAYPVYLLIGNSAITGALFIRHMQNRRPPKSTQSLKPFV